ncbi:Retrovirus-related Pol polyprotein, partial [Mucuna pruriens]
MLLVKKKDGGSRFCMDYCRLNKLTIKNKQPDGLVERSYDFTIFMDYMNRIFHPSYTIYSRNLEEHEEHLKRRDYIPSYPSEFCLEKVNLLDHVILADGIVIDLTFMKVRNFVGLVGSYWRFIKGLSKIVAPLTQLTQKDQPVQSFQELKKKITSSPILVLPNPSKPFEVYCDASHQGFGCLKIHEKNYLTHDLKLAAIIFELKIWRHYLYETWFDIL